MSSSVSGCYWSLLVLAAVLGVSGLEPAELAATSLQGSKAVSGGLGDVGSGLWPPVTALVKSSWDAVQGRGGKKGGGQGMMMMMGGMMLMMGLTGLAALAGKALAASMAALMLAAMSLMKKGGGGGGHHSTYEVVSVPHTGGGHHHRSIAEGEATHPPYHPTSYGTYETSAESHLSSPSSSVLPVNHQMSRR